MVGRHGEEREPPEGIQPADATFAAVFICGCVCVHVFRFFSAFRGAGIHLDMLEMTCGLGPLSAAISRPVFFHDGAAGL